MHPAPPSSTRLHPAPPSSTRLHTAHFNLHPVPSTSTQLISASTQLSAILSTIFGLKYCTQLGNFPKFRLKNKKLSFLKKTWHARCIKMLIPNADLDFWNSDPKFHFWANLGLKIQSSLFCLKMGTHSISRMLIPNPDLDFWNFDPKIHFWANLGPKSQKCLFFLKIGMHCILKMLIFIPH